MRASNGKNRTTSLNVLFSDGIMIFSMVLLLQTIIQSAIGTNHSLLYSIEWAAFLVLVSASVLFVEYRERRGMESATAAILAAQQVMIISCVSGTFLSAADAAREIWAHGILDAEHSVPVAFPNSLFVAALIANSASLAHLWALKFFCYAK